jgi:hypothetical protein
VTIGGRFKQQQYKGMARMWNSDVFTAVTSGVPIVPRVTYQISSVVQPPDDLLVTHCPNFCLFSPSPFL